MLVGTTLRNRYKIVKLLGKGGIGETYLAEDLDIPVTPKPTCVVKRLRSQAINPEITRLFQQEGEILYKLGQKCHRIPKLFAYFQEADEFFLIQEFIDGYDLSEEIVPGYKWSESEVIVLLQEILEVLELVHQENIIHRDIKPENLMRRNSDGKIVLIDFGAVKQFSGMQVNAQGQTTPTVSIGTLGYMPAEQSIGKPRLCSDIYAVGAIGIQALTGLLPRQFPEDLKTGEIVWRNLTQVSDRFANVIDTMVKLQFSQRYQSATEALQALRALPTARSSTPSSLQATTISSKTSPAVAAILNVLQPPSSLPTTPISHSYPSRRRFIIISSLVGVGVLSAIVWENFRPKSDRTPTIPNNNNRPSPLPASQTAKLPLKKATFDVVTLDSRGQETLSRQSGQFLTEDLGKGIGLVMVEISGGQFLMGSPDTELSRRSSESPQHSVAIARFFMSKYAIDQTKWQAIASLPKVERDLPANPSGFKGAELPVENISWLEAIEFCARLSKYSGRTYRLPTEAEWEYACRAGTSTPFHFGETISTNLANYYGDYTYGAGRKGEFRRTTVDVDKFKANAFGLYQMHGNVWEWCADYWHPNYQEASTDGSAWLGDGQNAQRILRGGSWGNSPGECRSASRFKAVLDYRGHDVGFRVCFSAT
ncbi:bifunctional serine/threonine-protein kinase/formylglycine-generating enzyme family protein [Pseudanabaena sp. PCC 6802]|uniref:bifunctional serine/threonine-protein kinase/formylglycine-generating enzyme family protein n=1 Tax=Pseudanabaena sp. PCC 6802 TaxID=118173 RepID=UPI00034ADA2B|nr:bifunctional serine/threonine-protein kinase/formylglycine-generating enzyme family protein [Pseudanabaena sp. PCC 6802]